MSKQKLDLELDDDDAELTVNKQYARSYVEWRKREELQKFKSKYGTDNPDEVEDEEEDSDSASSVEFAEWTVDNERDFLRTLGALKSKDPKIYRSDIHFFQEATEFREPRLSRLDRKKLNKEKPMTLRDYEQKLILERGGQLSDDDDQKEEAGPSYTEQEAQLKQELKNALETVDESDDDDSGCLLKKRVKTFKETTEEEDEYHEWLKGRRRDAKDVDDDLKNLKKIWQEDNLDDAERFLRDYILDKQYETDANPSAIGNEHYPTYDEIVREDDEEETREQFEVKYNFRFEEPDQDFVKQFPRTIAESIRKPDTRRKDARERRKQRREEEKKEREEEIRQIRAIQKAEAESRLKKLKKMAGEDGEISFQLDDLNKDFDPEEHDRMMKRLSQEEEDDAAEIARLKSQATSSAKKGKDTLEFRYRQVEPIDYGLSTDEILKLEDKQLNAWVSMKKVTGYRSQRQEKSDQMSYSRKAQDENRKKRVFASVPSKLSNQSKQSEQSRLSKQSKQSKQPTQPVLSKQPELSRQSKPQENDHPTDSENQLTGKKRKHRKRKSNLDLDAQRLRSYGVNTQKLKTALHKKKRKMFDQI